MTPLETLQKYGLKNDPKSIIERLEKDDYFVAIKAHGVLIDVSWHNEVKSADLALLCSLAEKGERYEKAVRKHYESAMEDNNVRVEFELENIITEAEGE